MTTTEKIKDQLKQIELLLIAKNKAYGNSALEPLSIFGSDDPVLGICHRIDDKLSRIKNQGLNDSEDTVQDLIGYLILLRIKLYESKK